MVTLSFICENVGPLIIAHMPQFMPKILEILKKALYSDGKKDKETRDLICLTSFMAIRSIIETIPQFISPYVSDFIQCSVAKELYDLNDRKAIEYASNVLGSLSTQVQARILLPPIFENMKVYLALGNESVVSLFAFLNHVFSNMSRTDLVDFLPDLTQLFLESFDLRLKASVSEKEILEKDIYEAEGSILASFLQLIMKLNETYFKPLFLRLVDSVTVNLSFVGLDDKQKVLRRFTFYRLVDAILSRLRVSYFTIWFEWSLLF